MNVKKKAESSMKKYIWITVLVALAIGSTAMFKNYTEKAKSKLKEVTA